MPGVSVQATPIFATSQGSGQVVPTGWNEMLVAVHNGSPKALRGEVEVSDRQNMGRGLQEFVAAAPFLAEALPAAATAQVPTLSVLVPDEMVAATGVPRLEEEAAWIERHRQLWSARFDALDKIVEHLKYKEKANAQKKRR